tara:strand:+ start:70 stop:1053 length:984 start_codon:yes stop_codon:yes gene_type:complete
MENPTDKPEKKKRGRKKNSEIEKEKKEKEKKEKESIQSKEEVNIPKKRGRKPKGGKIIIENKEKKENITLEPNIILHLKCFLKDIDSQNNELSNSQTYNPNVENIVSFNYNNEQNFHELYEKKIESNVINNNDDDDSEENNDNIKDIWKKLNNLKVNLHKNNISDKRSACFWCTHNFNNPPVFIPKYKVKDSYEVYGCFCTPECAVAFLMKENIDSSIRFERYQLINNVYGKIFDYEKNIKPAPDPYYLLDNFYGNLSIHEYRKLLRNDQILIIVDKPLTHVFPELYEDNNDFLLNSKTIPNNTSYQIKKKSQKKKNELLENLGINN